ncbi:hypothetical protein PAECIP111893_01310 [Paenibacillus plantiphilus]|uniref:Uncharacterized protein n=1 Tax=Paenibacillus plantiphilus TaxID=2905650 RepID=A0ABM9C1V6_9BACL|nr:hypothetical protein [Paenibacillus plantiphilus]CAH1199317.1 hypothetical protein PAECIP111893_01310 [Paenibacillus plantiphilus]
MTEKYIKLGATIDDIDKVTNDLRNLLQINFSEHESSYWGIYNLAKLSDSEEIKLGFNYVDDDWREEDHTDCPLILELNCLQQAEETMNLLCDKLSYLVPLYMKEIDSEISSKKYIFEKSQPKLVYEHFYKKRK